MNKDRNIENDDFKKQYPNLSSIPKENPFSTPGGFFETLPQSISSRIHKTKKPSLISVLFPAPVRLAFATVVVIAIIFVGFMWFNKLETNDEYIYDSYVEDYLFSYYDMNSSGLYQVLSEEDLISENEVHEYTEEDESILEYLVTYSGFYHMSPLDYNGSD